MRTEVVQFIEASARYDAASKAKREADEEFRDADLEFRATWKALTRDEREAVNDAYRPMRLSASSAHRPESGA